MTVVTPHPRLFQKEREGLEVFRRFKESDVEICWTGHRLKFLLYGFFLARTPRVFSAAFRGLKRLSGILDIDSASGWEVPGLSACAGYSPGDFDAILATGSPYTSFRMAAKLGERLQCPFFLDYRDPWTNGPHHSRPFRERVRRVERRLARRARGIITVSDSWAEGLQDELNLNKPVWVVSNGFDPDDRVGGRENPDYSEAIVYAGSFYPPKRVIEPVLRALKSVERLGGFLGELPRLLYLGLEGRYVAAAADSVGVGHLVEVGGMVDRSAALGAIKAAKMAVVITSVQDGGDTWDNGIVTGKLFELMNSRTPVLLIAPLKSDARKIVEAAGIGKAFTGSDLDGIAQFIVDRCAGRLEFGFDGIAEFSWRNLAGKLSRILRNEDPGR